MKKKAAAAKKAVKPRRAKGQTQTSISISEEVLEKAKQKARDDKRSLSQWIEILLARHFEAECAEKTDCNPTISCLPDADKGNSSRSGNA